MDEAKVGSLEGFLTNPGARDGLRHRAAMDKLAVDVVVEMVLPGACV